MQFCKDLLEFQRKISIKHLLIFQNVLLILQFISKGYQNTTWTGADECLAGVLKSANLVNKGRKIVKIGKLCGNEALCKACLR